jgi:FMN phosphatase YigB (HAD superfamily)
LLIIFDLDDTLIDTSACITPVKLKRAISRMIECGCDLQDEKSALDLLLGFDKESLSAREALQKFIALKRLPDQYYCIGLKEVYDTLPEGIVIKPITGAIETLLTLKNQAVLALVTAGKREQQLFKMEKAGIDSSFFYKIFISEKLDKKKYYKQLIEKSGIPPREVIVCGDRIMTDLLPAKELGCVTVHMKWGRGCQSQKPEEAVDFTITSLTQFLDVFRKVKDEIIFNGVQ